MNQKQIEYFMTVYRHRNVQRAADELHVSRQGVSKMIRSLEEELGEALFQRTSQGLIPTPYANALLPHVNRIAEEYQHIARMRSLASDACRVVTIASMDHIMTYLGTAFITAFREAHPDITLSVVDTTDEKALQTLATESCDFAIVPGPVTEETFVSDELFYSRYAVRLRREDSLAAMPAITYRDLDGRLMIGKGRAYACFRRHMDNGVFLAGYKVDILAEISDERLITELVERTGAIAVGYDYSAFLYSSPQIVVRPFGENGGDGQWIYMVRRLHSPLTAAAQVFRDFLLRWLENHSMRNVPWPDEGRHAGVR